MAPPAEVYAAGIKKRLRNYYATWLPTDEIQLGDIGELDGPYFSRISTLSDLGVSFNVRQAEHSSPISLVSGFDTSVSFKAAGVLDPKMSSIAQADAGVKVSFSRRGAFLVSAAVTFQPSIEHMVGVDQAIKAMLKTRKWDRRWAVVVRLIECTYATIMISRSSSSAVEIGVRGKSAAQVIDLGDATVSMEIGATTGDVLCIPGATGITPFFQVTKIQMGLFGNARTTTVRRRKPLPQIAPRQTGQTNTGKE